MQNTSPSGARLPAEFIQRIQNISKTDDLIDLIVLNKYFTWIDIRLIDAMASASDMPEALSLVRQYKSFAFSKSLEEILPSDLTSGADTKSDYLYKVSVKINRSPAEITVNDLLVHKRVLEAVIFDIREGMLNLESISIGCIEVKYCIPFQLVSHAYQCTLKSRSKFSDLHIRYVHFESYDKIYAMESSKPDLSYQG